VNEIRDQPESTPPPSSAGAEPPSPTFDPGVPGASAAAEYHRRRDKREADVRARHPKLGGLILALRDDPQHETAWTKGAHGERRTQQLLDERCPDDREHVVRPGVTAASWEPMVTTERQ
jgi:hypothetical protein